jgi:hypothetical protein
MPSPFPGMDPFIEGQDWEGFDTLFVAELVGALNPMLRPSYVARAERRVYLEHSAVDLPRTIRPGVAVVTQGRQLPVSPNGGRAAIVQEPAIVPLPLPQEVEEPFVEIRLRDTRQVVAVLETLSRWNKRPGSDGRREYLARREATLRSGAHLIELDLLRGGERLPTLKPPPPADYYAFVSRVRLRPNAEVWYCTLREPLPVIPVPLAGSDPDVALDLQAVFTGVYDRAGYDYSLDYRRQPEPPLSTAEAEWAQQLLTSLA